MFKKIKDFLTNGGCYYSHNGNTITNIGGGKSINIVNGKIVSSSGSDVIKGNREVKTLNLPLKESFSRIMLKSPVNVLFKKGDNKNIKITGESNIINLFKFNVENDCLIIEDLDVSYSSHEKIQIEITSDKLEEINLIGSGDFAFYNMKQPKFRAILRGSGDIILSGWVDSFIAELKGSGDISSKDLISNDLNVSVHGSGDITATALDHSRSKIIGSGDIVIYGSRKNADVHISGSGDIEFK